MENPRYFFLNENGPNATVVSDENMILTIEGWGNTKK